MQEREQTFLVRIFKLFVSFSILLVVIAILIVIPAKMIMDYYEISGLQKQLIYCGILLVFIFAMQYVPFLKSVRAYLRRMMGTSEQPNPTPPEDE